MHREKVRSWDGRLEVSDHSYSIWLRPDGSAQVLSRITWTSYDGETTAAGEYGGGTSHYSIGADRAGSEDEFLRDPATAVAGYWKVCAAQELIEEMETTVNDRQVKASVAALAARNAKAEVLHISGRRRLGVRGPQHRAKASWYTRLYGTTREGHPKRSFFPSLTTTSHANVQDL